MSSYDQWKTRGPDDDARTCEKCGAYLRAAGFLDWYCADCDEREREDEYWQTLADGEGSLIELEDAEILMGDWW